MAGLRTVVPDALPALGGAAVAAPLAALAATLVASLLAGTYLSRAKALRPSAPPDGRREA